MSSKLNCEGYCDLNIPMEVDAGNGAESLHSRVARAVSLGYQTVAVNVRIHQDDLTTKTKQGKATKRPKMDSDAKEKQGLLDFPDPPDVILQDQGKLVRVLKRLTLTFNDNNFLPIFNKSTTAKKYDLIALCPTSAIALRNLLKTGFRADIVTFQPENSRDVKWTRKLYTECLEKHLYFEICYAPMIRDSSKRKRIIAQAHNYHSYGKSKNIILTSSAETVMELRGPYDVANLGFLLGLNEHQGRLAVGLMQLDAIKAGQGRRLGPYRAMIQKIDDLPEKERWKVPIAGEASDNSAVEETDEEGSDVMQ